MLLTLAVFGEIKKEPNERREKMFDYVADDSFMFFNGNRADQSGRQAVVAVTAGREHRLSL